MNQDSSTRPSTVVEKSNEVSWDGPDDPANPRNWPLTKKIFLTFIVCLTTITVTFASSVPSPAVKEFQTEFGLKPIQSYLILTLFVAGFAIGPFLWAPGSEMFGRRPVFLLTLLIFALFQIGEARAQSGATLLVCRFLSGLFAASPLSNSGGVIADLWGPIGRGPAMSIFTAGNFLGPALGPPVGGFVSSSHLGWRWIFWIIMILAGTVFLVNLFWLPETYAPVLLQNKAQRLRKEDPVRNADLYAPQERADWSPKGILKRTVYRPLHMLTSEPMLLVVTVYTSMVYGLLYATFEAFPLVWEVKHKFSPGLTGLESFNYIYIYSYTCI